MRSSQKKIRTGLTVASALFATTFLSAQEKPLNIIYIMSDDHTEQMIGAYSGKDGYTPHIDRIASEGVTFRQSFVANSISGPSRACMLTGKHSHKNGKINNEDHFDGNQQTMPKILKANGYQTAMVGKWHLESNPTGFDYWEVLPGQGHYYQPEFITPKGRHVEQGYVTDIITDKSIKWLGNRDKTKPFALFVHHKATHRNWMPKIEDLHAYENQTFEVPANFFDNYDGRLAASTAEMGIDKHMHWGYDLKVTDPVSKTNYIHDAINSDDKTTIVGRMLPQEQNAVKEFYDSIQNDLANRHLSGRELAEWKFQRYMKDYLKTAKALDDNIGRLYAYLEKEGLLENTLVIYTSDQGFYMGEHGWFDKRFMYEESLRTPLVMRLPEKMQKQRGKTINQMVQNIDHAPTFLDIAGIEIPADIQGESYLPLLEGKNPRSWRNALYYHYQEYPAEHAVKRHYGIRTQRYKLIHFYNDIDTWELYDLKNDPTEMNNLIDNPAYAKTIKKLKKQLNDLQIKYDDPIRIKNEPLSFESIFDTSLKAGVSCYRIPSLVTAPNGDLIAAIDERVPHCGDLIASKDINIVIRRSTDNGKTWLPIETVIDFPFGQSASDPSMIVNSKTKEVFMFYNYMDLEKEKNIFKLHVCKSADNGKTWSKPVDITSQMTKPEWEKDFKFITSGRGLQTRSGQMLHTLVNLKHGVFVFGSNDNGNTWFVNENAVKPADESIITELSDGRLMINSRVNGAGRRHVHISADNGKTWQSTREEQLTDPSCNAGLISHKYRGKNYLIFSNANSRNKRENLTIRISDDNGKTWSAGFPIYSGGSAYSALTITKDGNLGIFFEKDNYTKNAFVSVPLKKLLQK